MTNEAYDRHRALFRDAPMAYVCAVATIPIIAGAVALLIWYVRARCETLRIENGHVEYNRGVFARDNVEMVVANIRSVRVDQTLVQRLFNVGDIYITSSGSAPEIVARGMPEVRRARRLLSPRSVRV